MADVKRHVPYLIFGSLLTRQTKPTLFTTNIYWRPSRLSFKSFWTAFTETAPCHHCFLYTESNLAMGGKLASFFLNLQCSEVIEIVLLLWGFHSLNTNCCAGIIFLCIIPPDQGFQEQISGTKCLLLVYGFLRSTERPFVLKPMATSLDFLESQATNLWPSPECIGFCFLSNFLRITESQNVQGWKGPLWVI